MKSSKSLRSILAAALLVGFSASAHAGATYEEADLKRGPSRTVRFADLDLSKKAGAETLYQRIRAAARSVCYGQSPQFSAECRATAVSEAVAGVGNSLLAAAHRAATVRGTETASRG
jgi:UrcA family protein